MNHPHPKEIFIPKAVLMKSGIKSLNIVGQNFSKAAVSVNTARPINTAHTRPTVNSARKASNVLNKAHTHVRRPFNKSTTNKNNNLKEKVNTVKGNVTTARPKAVVRNNKGNEANTSNPQLELQEKGVINSRCSRHMTGNKSYLSDYEKINGGFVAFGGDPKGGRITGKDNDGTMIGSRLHSEAVVDVCPLIRSDNGTEYKNKVMNQFYEMKGIKREFSVVRTPQQNGVAERKNRTLIEAARTMLADLKLPTTFWTEAFNTACYVQNRVLVIKPHNKTLYELFLGRKPALSFMRPFGCPITILNTIDHLGKFDGNVDEGFFVGYSTNNKAFKVFNSRTRIVEENLHVKFSKARVETVPDKDYILLPLWTQDPPLSSSLKDSLDAVFKPSWEEEKNDAKDLGNEDSEVPNTEEPRVNQEKDVSINSTNNINNVSPTVNAVGIENNAVDENIVYGCADDPNMTELEEIGIFSDAEDDNSGVDMNNLDTYFQVSPVPTTRIHKDHPLEQVIGDLHSAPQTRRMTMNLEGYGLFSSVMQRTNHKTFKIACLLAFYHKK
ncbi:retrovirus-related pol polyprotein from transposon TNT 1-94, partial [Tanacetum coccineum]